MPKSLRIQRRGKGSPKYLATFHSIADTKYADITQENENVIYGEIISLLNDPGRTAVIAEIQLENGTKEFVPAAEGVSVGQRIQQGKNADIAIGNVLRLADIPEGCPIFNIEKTPGDGGSFVRGSGLYALIMTKDAENVYVKMPSGKLVKLNPNCRATIGCVAGGGRIEKPFVKAGKKYHAMKARKRLWPIVRGVAMNAVDHPFGGSQHHPGKSKSTSRHAAPRRKVGAIASKRTGRRKK